MLMSFQTEGTANTTPRVSRNTEEAQVGGDGGEGGNGVGRSRFQGRRRRVVGVGGEAGPE